MIRAIPVSLGKRSYDIAMGPLSGLASRLRRLGFAKRRALLVTTRSVAAARHVSRLTSVLRSVGSMPAVSVLPDGESHKNIATLTRLYEEGFRARLDRASVVIGLGGGVVTDMAGFLSATYMRGISFLSVPTTLLGMVDAAIGGKTGVDLPEGKNLVGAFWQPRLVWIDPATLKTLPPKEWRTGFAEVIKYGVIRDRGFFDWLERRVAKEPRVWRWSSTDIVAAIHRSAAIKAAVVSGDERETPLKGGREILNFGHTAGHALEAATGYRRVSHGEAISIGMGVAGAMAMELNLFRANDQARMLTLLAAAGLPTRFPRLSPAERKKFWQALSKDKKNIGGRLRFVLPQNIGRVRVQSGIPLSLVQWVCRRFGL